MRDTFTFLFVTLFIVIDVVNGQALGSVNNLRLRGVTIQQAPYVFYDSTAPPQSQYYGFAIDLYNQVFSLLGSNNTFDLYLVPDGNFGADTGNGTWNGMVGEILNGNADIIVGPLSETSARYSVLDFTVIYTEVGFRIIVNIPSQKGNPFSFFDPFDSSLWVLILFTAFIMAFVMWLIDRNSPYGRTQTKEPGDENQFDLPHSVHNALLTAIGQGGDPGTSWSTKILLLGYFFFALIITATYTANLAAFLTTQSLAGTVSSVDDINKDQVTWAAVNNSVVSQYFISTTVAKYRAITPLMKVYPTYDDCLTALRSHEVGAVIHVDVISDYYAMQHPCDTMISGNTFLKSAYAVPLPKGSNLTYIMSEALIQLREQGEIDTLYREWYDDTAVCKDPTEEASSNTMTVPELAGLFYLLIIFIAVAFMTLVSENVIWKFRHQNQMMKSISQFCGIRPEPHETNMAELHAVKH